MGEIDGIKKKVFMRLLWAKEYVKGLNKKLLKEIKSIIFKK
jgi:hypothetical protein